MNDERLERIETKLAYQEAALQDLSDLIYAQQKHIDRLDALCRRLLERLESLSAPPGSVDPADEVPPHY